MGEIEMVASTLAAGDVAIVAYHTDNVNSGQNADVIRFVLLAPIGSGTQIFFTDRTWNGTTFAAAGGGEGTFTYTAGADLPAGTVITITNAQLLAAGINLADTGETLYAYQGAIDTPTTFLYAADIADGNSTFNGSLTGTGLTAGTNAVAVAHDNAVYTGSSTQIAQTQLSSVSNNTHWQGSDQDDIPGTANYSETSDTSLGGPLNNPDMLIVSVMAGGGQSDAILTVDNDENANVGTNLTRLFRDNANFNHLSDLTWDIEAGFFFVVDSDGNSINRILRGNISDLRGENATPTLTQIFITDNQSNGAGPVTPGEIIVNIEINTTTNKIYWMDGNIFGDYEGGFQLLESNYDGTGLRLVQTLDTENVDTTFGFPGGVGDFAVYNTGNVAYVVHSTASIDGLGNANVLQNHIIQINLTTGATTILGVGTDNTGNAGRLLPSEGQIIGIDVDQRNGDIYFITQPISSTDVAGIFKYVPGTDTLTELWTQPSNATHNTLQTFPTSNMTHIEFDEVANRYYVSATSDSDTENDGSPGTNESDASIFIGNPAGGAPTLFVRAYEPTANGAPQGMEIDYAPTVTGVVSAGSTYTESTNALSSPAGTPVQVSGAPTIADADQAIIKGATVAITTGFMVGDTLGFTNSGGITGSYNAATGVITFTGDASFAAYQTVLDSITYVNAGDNPTNYGASPTRVISFTVTDGLLNSDPATATVNVVGINDAPVNSVGAGGSVAEDVGSIAVTGISVSDVDANPATQDITVTLTAEYGVLTVLTNVVGGLAAGEVANNGTATITLTGTQNQINATLAAVNGLVLGSIPANLNGGIDITVVTNDGGFNGNDPGLTGTGTTEQDSDVRVITVTAVNDAPTVAGDGTETAAQVTEDSSSNSLTQTFTAVLAGQYSDAADDQFANGGTSAGAFTGVAVIANGSTAGTGQWQAWNGSSWVNIGTASEAAAQTFTSTTPFRFSPVANFNGPAPTLTVVLIDSSGPAIVFGGDVDVSTRGGTTPYSTGTVVISQPNITAVNDAPTVTGGSTVTLLAVNEDTTNPAGDTVANIFGSRFSDAADNVSGGSSANSFAGIMIGIDNSNAAQGHWQVFTGGSWSDLPTLSPTNTYLVSASDSLRFVPAPNYNGTPGTLVVLLIDDSAGAVVTGTRLDSSLTGSGGTTVYSNSTMSLGTSITSVNDAPAVNADTTATFTEGQGAIAVTPAYTVADVDSANLTGATISVSDFAAGDLLGFTNQNGISGIYNSGTGVLTLTGSASVANYQAAIRSITYNFVGDANAGGTDNTRTVNVIVTDGVDPSSQTATVITIVDSGGDAQDDAFSVTESGTITGGDLLADNGSGADTTVTSVIEVNGQVADIGVEITLASGALLTVNSDGTFDYDPNGAFDDLVDASAGAGNSVATDTFTYTVDGGDVATVTITINGETDTGDIYQGTAGADTVTGGGTGNTMNLGGGNDTAFGLGGGDVINGEAGDDTLNGGDQADKLNGGDDNDQLNGEEGNDILSGGAGADDLVGGNGNDTLDGGTGADDMNGGDGSDIYFVDDAGDTITDSSGIDTVRSTGTYILGAGLEHLTLLGSGDSNGTGNASNNTINGNDGVNVLSGMDGADKLYGFGGKDVLNGGAGADVIDGGDSNDVVNGGADNDTAAGGNGNDILNGDDGNDQLDGGVGADKLFGGAGIDQLTGGLGNDYMYGGDGVDTMNGNDGNDYLDGGVGPDKMYGGVGNDVYIVNEYNDFILENVGEGFDVVRSFASYVMGENLEALELQAGAGDIAGTGNNGANTITGNEGVNVLDGKGGVDTIRGGDGNDVIFGGLGNDLLYGQAGWDVFAVRQESVSLMTLETDRIFDLNIAGGDRVDLSAIDADSTTMGNQAFQFATVLSTFSGVAGEATLTYDAATASTYLRLDVNGDKKADYSLRIDGDHTGTSGNIIAPGAFLDGSGGWIL